MVPPQARVGKHPAQWHIPVPRQSQPVLSRWPHDSRKGRSAAAIGHSTVQQTRTRATTLRSPLELVPLPPPVDTNRNGWVMRFTSAPKFLGRSKSSACMLRVRMPSPHLDRSTCPAAGCDELGHAAARDAAAAVRHGRQLRPAPAGRSAGAPAPCHQPAGAAHCCHAWCFHHLPGQGPH